MTSVRDNAQRLRGERAWIRWLHRAAGLPLDRLAWAGFIYLAVVLDVWSRRIVGWAIGESMTAELMLAALNMALQRRKPEGVIHHSDQDSQYTSVAFGERCKKMGVQPSMGTVGDAYDNAMAESFFASLECELIDRNSWQTKTRRAGTVHLHRGLVQPASPAQRAGLPLAGQLRKQTSQCVNPERRTRVDHRRRLRGMRHAAGL